MNCKALEGRILGVHFVGPRHFPGGTEENREQLASGWPVSAPTFEPVVF
jgi:hypothetical protein